MSIKEENELLIALTQQSAMLRRTLDDLNGVWSDEAARTLNSRHLSPHLAHDEHILHALETQTELHFEVDGLLDTASQHIAEVGNAHRSLNGHILYAQQQMGEAERKRRDSLLLQQEVRDMILKVQQLLREADR